MTDYWKTLLRKQQERGKKGFTLPYLIGSQQYLTPTHRQQDIKELIEDMVKNDVFETCIRYCLDTNAIISEIRNQNNVVKYPTFKNGKQTQLSIPINDNSHGETVEELISSLIDKYQDKIDSGKYSATRDDSDRETKWHPFSPSDEKFIKECFGLT
jgi:hypothetical protein